ncbi:unnamed protein product [Arabidopsis arenosa]|uniref:Arabidopsis retrotransposon Orf1 C-terminal domain-containing protein n=1 Tax=Arabidopsis arenosa TaxID=38785 RepID=A0A8S2B1T1_ARAAE|nr:unnamed protein product [Arabidopsis arenosa]
MNPQDVLPEGVNPPPPALPEGGNNPPNVLPAAAGPVGLILGPNDPRATRPIDPAAGPVDPLVAAQPARTLGEQDTLDRFYANRSALRPPNPTRQDYEINNNVENPQDMVYPPRQQGAFNKPSTFPNYPPKPAAPQENKLETMMHSLIESHKKNASEINAKIDGMYGDLNGKFTTLATRVDSLDKRVSYMASSSKGKEACNAVVAHSGVNTSFNSDVFGDVSSFHGPGSTDLPTRSTDPPAGFTLLTREVRSTDPTSDRSIRAVVPGISDSFSNENDAHFVAKADVLPYKPQSPYPLVPKAKIDEKKYNRSKDIIGELIKEATLSEALGELPFLKKICRDVINGTEDAAEVDAYLAKRKEARDPKLVKVEKLEDPGKFVVPCSIDGEVFANSLCDSGSSVNVMSMATVRRLDLQGMETSQCSLKFANASTTTPQGFIGDVEVRIGNHLVPTDFHVVEMSGGSETPLILGRAFLTTVGAVFDLEEPKMTFTKIDKNVAYHPVLETNRSGSNFANVFVVMKRTPRIRVNRQWPFPPHTAGVVKRNCNCNPPCFDPTENQGEMRDEIHPHDLNMFEMRVRMVPDDYSFEEAWFNYPGLQRCFWRSREPFYAIEAHFYRSCERNNERRCLPKMEDPGCFVIPCAINGVSVYNCLCDSGAGTSVIPTAIASRCGITDCFPSTTNLYMADESVVVPRGELHNEMVRIGDVDVPTDFKVVDVPGKRQQVIFGRAFLNTVGAVIDTPNRRVCFTNVDKEVFYHVTPRGNAVRPIRIEDGGRSVSISGGRVGEPATGEREWTQKDQENTIALRACTFEPTRFLETDVLRAMGILDDVLGFLRNAGFGSFPEKRWDIYPNAAAEFLATLQTFGSGEYVSRGAKQALIRNPVIRLAVRFMSSTIFARAEMGTLQLPELSMCFYGLHPFITDPTAANYNKTHRVNFAALLVQEFIQVAKQAFRSKKKAILIGILVTPIITHCRFNIAPPVPEHKARFIDREHLYASEILIRHSLVYRFQGSDGVYRYIRLPRIDLTSLAIPGNIRFNPTAGALCERPIPPKTSGVRRAARTRCTDEAGPSEPSSSQPPPFQPFSGQVPPFELDVSAYTATDPPAEPATEMERWICETTKKNNTLLTKIATWLCCVAPPPPPPPPGVPTPVHESDPEDDTFAAVFAVRTDDVDEEYSSDPPGRSHTWHSSSSHDDSETSVQDDFRIRTRRKAGDRGTPPSL